MRYDTRDRTVVPYCYCYTRTYPSYFSSFLSDYESSVDAMIVFFKPEMFPVVPYPASCRVDLALLLDLRCDLIANSKRPSNRATVSSPNNTHPPRPHIPHQHYSASDFCQGSRSWISASRHQPCCRTPWMEIALPSVFQITQKRNFLFFPCELPDLIPYHDRSTVDRWDVKLFAWNSCTEHHAKTYYYETVRLPLRIPGST